MTALLALSSHQARAEDGLATRLHDAVEAQRLWEDPEWTALVHYKTDWLGRPNSLADDPAFFLSPEGKHDPRAELLATLDAFAENRTVRDSLPAACAFPLRLEWLVTQLGEAAADLPLPECPRLAEWFGAVAPRGATLVYPAAYMNNPASMFGHTLLRLDSVQGADGKPLLDYSINFAAEVPPDENAVVFAVLGITGFYPGYFSLAPYYIKVNEYNDIEDRDIWEYPLDIDADQVRHLVLHMWELRNIRFDYYFFDENCSYMLLALMEVLYPGSGISDGFPIQAIPVDTMRRMFGHSRPGKPVFRASLGTTLNHRASLFPPRVASLVRDLVRDEAKAADAAALDWPEREKAATLEMAYDDLRYQFLAENITREDSVGRAIGMMKVRSAIDAKPGWDEVPTPTVDPAQGHRTGRVGTGWLSRHGRPGMLLQYRYVFHDQLDPPGGYVQGAQINALEFTGRLRPDGPIPVEFERIAVVDILSLSPRSALFNPLSWRVQVGARQRALPVRGRLTDRLTPEVRVGLGGTWSLGGAGLAYGMAEAGVELHERLQDGHSAGPGVEAGWILNRDAAGGLHLIARHDALLLGERHQRTTIRLESRVDVTPTLALRPTLEWIYDYDRPRLNAMILAHVYY